MFPIAYFIEKKSLANIYMSTLNYNSITGIPSFNMNNSLGNGMRSPFFLLLLVLIIVFLFFLVPLGRKEDSGVLSSSGSGEPQYNFLNTLFYAILVCLILLNGLMYFFNINLSTSLKSLFSDEPLIDLTYIGPEIEENNKQKILEEKKQVFHIPDNLYTYDDAQAICKAYNSRLATYDEIADSHAKGGEWCSYGWSKDQLSLFPTQTDTYDKLQKIKGHEHDCGRPGINGGFIANPNVRFGVNCYGKKPDITQEELNSMENDPIYPKSMEDIKQEKLVQQWKNKIPEIMLSPFNKEVWSV